jgi:hypothetical protein
VPTIASWFLLASIALFCFAPPALADTGSALDLASFEKQVYSQGGEDGIIEKLFELIEPTAHYAVEFGASDGISGSNVRRLYEQGWGGLQIEGDPGEYQKLVANTKDLPKVKNLNAWVWPGNIEHLFEQAGVPKDLDFLVIDIDSNDYWIWKVIHDFRPKVVQIEFNAAFAPPQSVVVRYHPMNHADSTDYYGASIQALYELGKKKGYELVYCNKSGINLFFVDKIYFERFGIADNSPTNLYVPPQFGYKKGARAPNGRGWQRAEAKGPLEYRGGKVNKVFERPPQ